MFRLRDEIGVLYQAPLILSDPWHTVVMAGEGRPWRL